jgi:acyl phosphate:glycerol-3-phosphate acyltransferase
MAQFNRRFQDSKYAITPCTGHRSDLVRIALLVVVCYLLGSLSGSLLLGKWRGVDIRTQGSGNAGGTNAFRTQGAKFALLVLLIDILKGMAAVWIGIQFGGAPVAVGACLAAAVVGHIWPIFFGFRGGKGAATYLGGGLLLAPSMVWMCLVVWILSVLATGYVGLSTMLGCAAFPALFWWYGQTELALITAFISLLVIAAHHRNLRNMWRGTEHRFHKAWLLGRLLGKERS